MQMGFFQKLKDGLKKTSDSIANVFAVNEIDDDFYDDLEETLISADMGFETTEKVIDDLKDKVEELHLKKAEECKELVMNSLRNQMEVTDRAYGFEDAHTVVFVIGVNGVGKTTSIGKLAAQYKNRGKKVLVAAADTFRAGAIAQLKTWTDRAGVDLISQGEGSDPSAVVYDAVSAAKARKADLLLVDTAGRLHNKKNLMDELAKMRRVIEREYPEAYVETLIVLDGSTGQNALEQARQFSTVTEINGIIITKLDGTAKGGIAVAIQSELSVPVKYIGVGEKIDDLQRFDPDEYIQALFSDFGNETDLEILMRSQEEEEEEEESEDQE
ncbi:MAG: signal recognition particle-docking protein FtsY [Lachnospiraceae bacterium]|nr:signal recognition particle-docking protein FtsY [Lachnospiraceae bacterium]